MSKRQRLERVIAGDAVDRIPAALWRHFPGDDQRPADLAHALIEYQKTYDWDFAAITPSPSASVTDYGLQDQWRGALDGSRSTIKQPIKKSLDWTELRPLDPARGELAKLVEAARLTCEGLSAGDAPILLVVYSPLTQAKMLSGQQVLLRHLRTHADRLQSGLNILTESSLRLFDTLRRLPLDGVIYVIDQASHDIMTESEYQLFGIPYDRKILAALPEKWWFRLVQLQGEALMFRLFEEYDASALLWNAAEPDLAQGKSLFSRAVAGGVSMDDLLYGTPSTVRDSIRTAAQLTHNRRFIVAGNAPIAAPLSNLRAVRQQVEIL
jgi:uroporphyrinogen decarboxylase